MCHVNLKKKFNILLPLNKIFFLTKFYLQNIRQKNKLQRNGGGNPWGCNQI